LTFDCYGTLIDGESGMTAALGLLTSRLAKPLSRNEGGAAEERTEGRRLERVRGGAAAGRLPSIRRARVRATGATLSKKYLTEQLMDAVFTVGQYNLVSWVLNSLGVPLDDFLPGAGP
jgi:hypothetical protein